MKRTTCRGASGGRALIITMGLALITRADAAPAARSSVVTGYAQETRNRAAVLLIGSTLTAGVAERLQSRWSDEAAMYRPLTPVSQVAEARAAAEGTDADASRMAYALSPLLRWALFSRSTPWAEPLPGPTPDPARLLADPQLLASPLDLPEANGTTATVYRAEAGGWQFNLHSFVAHHAGKFWAIWSSGRVNEDSSSQMVRYATSPDGLIWGESQVLMPDPDGENGPWRWMASGIYVDAGTTWTIPVKTNYPDAVSKNMSGRLSNGWYYLISNPKDAGANPRDPLAITFSRDGWTFSHPWALRKGAPPLRHQGGAKGAHSFQYSHAIEHAGQLWVIYATNKEDIEITAYPIDGFGLPP